MYNDLMSIIDEACLPREENEQANISRDFMRFYLDKINQDLILYSLPRYDIEMRYCIGN